MSGLIFFQRQGSWLWRKCDCFIRKGSGEKGPGQWPQGREKKKLKVGPGLAGCGNCGARWATVCELVDLSSVLTTAYDCTPITITSITINDGACCLLLCLLLQAVCILDSYLLLWENSLPASIIAWHTIDEPSRKSPSLSQ
jgi:hypothetical protein